MINEMAWLQIQIIKNKTGKNLDDQQHFSKNKSQIINKPNPVTKQKQIIRNICTCIGTSKNSNFNQVF